MSLNDTLMSDYKEAFKAKNQIKKEILNFVIAQIKNKKIDLKKDPTDEDIIGIIKKEIKSRKEAISFLEKAGNQEEIDIENNRISILEEYLPEMLSKETLTEIVKGLVESLGIEDLRKQRGMVIGAVMKDHKAQTDGALLNEIINEML